MRFLDVGTVISLSVEQMALSKSSLRGILRKFDIEQWSHWSVRFDIGYSVIKFLHINMLTLQLKSSWWIR